jgi:AraC-like DNA-binding protein
MTEISRIVGFNTLRTFNRAFVKQIGVTPSEYKKRLEGGISPASIPI